MPYKRRQFPKRKRFGAKKQPIWKRMMKVGRKMYSNIRGPLGYAIRNINYMKNLINSEKKFIDTTVFNSVVITTGITSAIPMTLLANGTSDVTRNGNSVLANALEIKGTLVANATALTNVCRVVCFIDKQNAGGTAPVWLDVHSAAITRAFMNVQNTDRFVILRNQVFSVSTTGPAITHFEWHIPLNGLHIKYDGTAADQASAAENHIYCAAMSDDGTNGPTLAVLSRFSFYDN